VFSEVMTDCFDYVDVASGRRCKTIADDVYAIIMANKVRSYSIGPTVGNTVGT
jgi:hypothetical protein